MMQSTIGQQGITRINSTSFTFPKTQYQLLALIWDSVPEKREYKQAQFKWCHPSLLLGPIQG